MRKLLGLVGATLVAATAVVVLATGPAAACSCAGDPISMAEEFDAIFVGRPVGAPRPLDADLDEGPPGEQLVIEVSDVYEGDVAARQAIVVPSGGGSSCGIEYDGSGELLVLGSRRSLLGSGLPEGVYGASYCSTVWLGADPAMTGVPNDLTPLGEPHPPDTGESPTIPTSTRLLPHEPVEWAYLVGGTLVLLCLIGGAAWFIGRIRRAPSAEPGSTAP